MKKYLNKYMNSLPEKFNKEFIMSRDDQQILKYAKDILKSLEILPEIHIDENDIRLDTDEASFGPIKQQGKYYKSVLPSRFNKLHFKVKIDGVDKPIEKDLFINKMLDNCFYINEGVRYFLIWQIVDAATYGFGNGTSFKTRLMPITMLSPFKFDLEPEFGKPIVTNLNMYEAALFKGKVSPFLYIIVRKALESLAAAGMEKIDDLDTYLNYQDESILDYIREFYEIPIKFSDNLEDLCMDDWTTFAVKNDKETGIYFSIPDDLVNTPEGRAFIASFGYIKLQEKKSTKKRKLIFKYDDLIRPSFWINQLATIFNNSNDPFKKYEKVKTIYLSLIRVIDEPVRKTVPIDPKYKEDVFSIFKYEMLYFNELANSDGQDLTNKRIRLYEYMLYPLCSYFSQKIYQIWNAPNKNVQMIEKIFTGLTPLYLVKQCITSELLRYYNATNEFDLYTALLKYTFHGPQGYTESVSIDQRSINPSYTGRLSLVASSAGNPGTTGTMVPFVKIYDGYFVKQNIKN